MTTATTEPTVPAASPDQPPRPTAARAVGPLSPEYRAVTIGMVALVALSAFEALAVTTTMPTVVAALGGIGLYAMAFAGPLASGVVGMVAAGGWADRRGPAAPLFTGVALFVAGLVIAGTAATMGVLVSGRVVQGLGSGMLTVALYVVVARVFPDGLRARVFALFAAAWVLPSVVGPLIAGLISQHLGWRWVFLSVPVLVVPAVLILRPALRRSSQPDEDLPDDDAPAAPAGSSPAPSAPPASSFDRPRLLRALGAGTGVLALHVAGQQRGLAAVLVGLAGLALLAGTVPGLLPRGTLRAARGLPAVIVVRGLLGAAFFGAEVYLPLLFTTERGLSPSQAGLALTAAALTWSTGSWLRGRYDGRWDDRTVLRVGCASIALGVGFAALAIWPAFPVAASLAGWGAAGLGMGLTYPMLSLLTLRLSEPEEQGVNTSALQLNESLAAAAVLAASGPVFAALVANDATPAAYLTCFAVSALLAATAAAVAGRILPADTGR
ncbi:MFS transporter [Pengzhenrongella sp.]|jgi:MFS family permease|uniref:MFS transporter n=1 Tax=Pengzhenrongella sp. TaxID=2888820 RepID=UPI002F929C27